MRRGIVAGLTAVLGVCAAAAPAAAETLTEKAELWGALHGAAIYCGRRDSDDFGRAAMVYFQRRAGSAAEFGRLRDAYGLTAIRTAHVSPTRAAGGNCYGFSEKYQEVWKILRGG